MVHWAFVSDIDKQAFSHLLNVGSIGKALSCWMNINLHVPLYHIQTAWHAYM